MPRIVVKRNNSTYKEFLLRPFQSRITVGSHSDNDLILADTAVREHHFAILKKNSHYFIEPLDAVASLSVNGEKISAATRIKSGDVIEIGVHNLLFENELHEAAPAEAAEIAENDTANTERQIETAVEKKDAVADERDEKKATETEKETIEEEPKKTEDAADEQESEPHFLIAVYGPYLGNVYQLKTVTTKIGRDRLLNDIVIDRTPDGKTDTSISRRHATVVHSEGEYFLLDKRSKTRTRLNGKELSPEQVAQLFADDEIEIVSDRKSTIFRFCKKSRMNFSRPRRSGTWWLRNRRRAGLLVSAAIILLLGFLIFNFSGKLSIIQQKPEKLEMTSSVFFQQKGDPSAGGEITNSNISAPFYSVAAADFNGDKFVDVAFFDKLGYLTIIDGKTKRELWERTARIRGFANCAIVLADLNEDNLKDLIVAGYNTIISGFEGKTGMEFWTSPILGGEFTGTPIVGKLNDDAYSDVFVASREGILDVGIGSYGESEWRSLDLMTAISMPPAAKDLNQDGAPEIFFVDDRNKIFSSKLVGDSLSVKIVADLSSTADLNHLRITLPFIFADVNKDEKEDLVGLSDDNVLFALDLSSEKIIATKKIFAGADSGEAAILFIHDFGKKSSPRIVVATPKQMACYATTELFAGGETKSIWSIPLPEGEFLPRQMVAADIDKDEVQDVVVPILPPGIAVISGENGILRTSTAKAKKGAFPIGVPVVADFNSDAFIDILQRMSDNRLQLFSTNSRIPKGTVLWGQAKGNSCQNSESATVLKPKWFFSATILLASLLIFVIFAVNFIAAMRRKSLFPREISSE